MKEGERVRERERGGELARWWGGEVEAVEREDLWKMRFILIRIDGMIWEAVSFCAYAIVPLTLVGGTAWLLVLTQIGLYV